VYGDEVALNVIARTKLGCKTRDYDHDTDSRDDLHFNYAQFDFNQAQGSTAGLRGDYIASHVVGGLAWHF